MTGGVGSLGSNPLALQYCKNVVKIRRTTKPLAANFVCIDGQELVVIENSPGDFDVDRGTDRAAWTTNKLLVGLYENLFERVWESSSPLHQ
jgi:hypothetical protein